MQTIVQTMKWHVNAQISRPRTCCDRKYVSEARRRSFFLSSWRWRQGWVRWRALKSWGFLLSFLPQSDENQSHLRFKGAYFYESGTRWLFGDRWRLYLTKKSFQISFWLRLALAIPATHWNWMTTLLAMGCATLPHLFHTGKTYFYFSKIFYLGSYVQLS